MSSYNKFIGVGNLTRDPETKEFGNNKVCNFSIAMNRKYKKADGEMCEEVTFLDCEAWGRTADLVSQYLTKGSNVLVEGRIKMEQWEAQDGSKRSKLKISVNEIQFMDKKSDGAQPSAAPHNPPVAAPVGMGDDDQPPF